MFQNAAFQRSVNRTPHDVIFFSYNDFNWLECGGRGFTTHSLERNALTPTHSSGSF